MEHTESTPGAPVGAILAIVGGALLAVGSFLAWAEVSGGGTSVTAKGVDGSDGYVTLATGLIAIVVGIALTRRARRLFAVLALVAGLIGGGFGLYDALTAKDNVLDSAAEELAPSLGASAEQVRTLLDQAIDAGQLAISISIGLYVVIAGGALAALGGILSMRGSAEPSPAAGTFTAGSTPMPAPTGGPPPPDEPPAPPPAFPTEGGSSPG